MCDWAYRETSGSLWAWNSGAIVVVNELYGRDQGRRAYFFPPRWIYI